MKAIREERGKRREREREREREKERERRKRKILRNHALINST